MSKKPNQFFRNINAKIASIPMILTVLVVFLGGSIWTIFYSFTSSKLLPKFKFVGFDQYERLWETRRWIISIENLALYGIFSLVFSLSKVNPIKSVKTNEKIPYSAKFSIEIIHLRVSHKRSY